MTFHAKRVLIPALIIFIIALVGLFLWHPWSGFESPPGDTEKPSIAVLPFEDLSPQKDQDYLCVGLAESLINALSKIQDLRVPARTSSFSFQGKDYIIRDIGERLDVQTVLTGSLQRAENRIRITTQLISTADESLLWSEQYNRELDDVFGIQDEISRSIVETLRVRLGAAERAGLADTYMLLGLFAMISRDEAAQQAKMAARRALELDGNSSEAHTSFGVILEVFDWDWEEAEREFKRAIDLNPNFFDAHYEYGFLLARLKKLTEAEAELKKALRIDPLSVRGHQVLGRIYTVSGNEEKADEHIKKGDELSSQPYLGENAVDRARGLIEKDGRLPQHLRQLSIAYIESGQDAEARKLLKELEQLYERSDVGNIAYSVTRVYLHYDDYDQALRWLEKSFQRRDPSLISINIYTFYEPLRKDPRFKAILAKMGLE